MKARRTKASAARPRAPSSPSGRDAQAAARREQLLSAALALFGERGYAGTSTRSIAEAAGVAEGLVYHYFPTKEALLLELGARHHTFAGRVLVALEGAGERTARELLQSIAEGLTLVSSEELSFLGFMLAESQVNERLRSMVREATANVLEAFVALLERRVTGP